MNNLLSNLRAYSFCKSHSYSYAQLVYKIAYEKAHNPYKFWKSTLKIVVVHIENGFIYMKQEEIV